MSSEAASLVLDDLLQAGVYFVTGDDLPPLSAAATRAGLHVHPVNLAHCRNKTQLLTQLANVLDVPEGLGHNWDALSDQVRDLSWLAAPGHALLFSHAEGLRDADEDSFDTLLDILEEASLDWQERGQPFWGFFALPDAEFPLEP